jgi:hypothetical protein
MRSKSIELANNINNDNINGNINNKIYNNLYFQGILSNKSIINKDINNNLNKNIIPNEMIKKDKISNINTYINTNININDKQEIDNIKLSPIENALKEASVKGVKFEYNDVSQSYELVNKIIPIKDNRNMNDEKNKINSKNNEDNKLINQIETNNIITNPITTSILKPKSIPLINSIANAGGLAAPLKSRDISPQITQISPQFNVTNETEAEQYKAHVYKEPSFKDLHENDYIRRDRVYKNVLIKHVLKFIKRYNLSIWSSIYLSALIILYIYLSISFENIIYQSNY